MQIAMKMGTGVVQADPSVSLVLPKQRQNCRQTQPHRYTIKYLLR